MRLADAYRAFLLDLDGVLFRGDHVVPGGTATVAALRRRGAAVVFLTNNSSGTPEQVAEKLARLGYEAAPEDVVTSAQATARLIAGDAGETAPATAYVVGEEGLRAALADAGIVVVDGEPDGVGFVVVGWDRGATYDRLRTASVLIRRGARFVATNPDPTYPAAGGDLWPGAGALVAAVQTAAGSAPTVVGKPHPPLFEAALERAGTRDALVVGDRLETDVAGAAAAGLDSVLVRTGAASLADLLDHRAQPAAVLEDVSGLLDDRLPARVRPAAAEDASAVASLLEAAGLDPIEARYDAEGMVMAGDDDPVATASVDVRGDEGYLRSVAVAERARDAGLGALVVAAAVRRAADRGATAIHLVTEDAVGFFQRLGFGAVERGELPGWIVDRARACPGSATAMRRRLVSPRA